MNYAYIVTYVMLATCLASTNTHASSKKESLLKQLFQQKLNCLTQGKKKIKDEEYPKGHNENLNRKIASHLNSIQEVEIKEYQD